MYPCNMLYFTFMLSILVKNLFIQHESHDRKKLLMVLEEMEVKGSRRDHNIMEMVCEAVSLRAARLAAAGLAAIVKVVMCFLDNYNNNFIKVKKLKLAKM